MTNETPIEVGREERLQSLGQWAQTIDVLGVTMTPQQDQLLEALSAFQGELATVVADSVANVGRKYNYPSLGALLEAANPLLAKNGLCLTQSVATEDDGLWLTTRLGHSSGQWQSSRMKLLVTAMHGKGQIDMQALGSAITYARRYAGFAILGVAPTEDDDGHAAVSVPPLDGPMQGRSATLTTFDDRHVPEPPPEEMPPPPPPPPSSRKPTTASDPRWFADEDEGNITGWILDVYRIASGNSNNGPWTLTGVRLMSGEELKTFSTETADACRATMQQKCGAVFGWKRVKRSGKPDGFDIESMRVLQPGTEADPDERMVTIREVTAIEQNGVPVAASVITDCGRFGTTDLELADDLGTKIDQEWLAMFTVNERGRLITSVMGAGQDATAEEPVDVDATDHGIDESDIPF